MNGYKNPALLALALALATSLPPTIAAITDPTRRALVLLAAFGITFLAGIYIDRNRPLLGSRSNPPPPKEPKP